MKRVLVLALAVTAVAGGSAAYSGTTGGGIPGGSAVWGGGHVFVSIDGSLYERDFSVVAHNGAGTLFWGNYNLASPLLAGNVTCVNVSGNQAVIGGFITDSYFHPELIGTPWVWYVRDNGAPITTTRDQVTPTVIGYPSKDILITDGLPAQFPRVCPSALDVVPGIGFADLTAGDLVVQSASS